MATLQGNVYDFMTLFGDTDDKDTVIASVRKLNVTKLPEETTDVEFKEEGTYHDRDLGAFTSNEKNR